MKKRNIICLLLTVMFIVSLSISLSACSIDISGSWIHVASSFNGSLYTRSDDIFSQYMISSLEIQSNSAIMHSGYQSQSLIVDTDKQEMYLVMNGVKVLAFSYMIEGNRLVLVTYNGFRYYFQRS